MQWEEEEKGEEGREEGRTVIEIEHKNIVGGSGKDINSLAFVPSKMCSYTKPAEAKRNKRKISTESH